MTEPVPRPRRSFISVPGLRPETCLKALASGADIVCVAPEDGIVPKNNATARTNAKALLAHSQSDHGVARLGDVVLIDDPLTWRGHATRLPVVIVTNRALEAAHEIARCLARIDALFFGEVDMAADLRCDHAWEPSFSKRFRKRRRTWVQKQTRCHGPLARSISVSASQDSP